MRLEVLNLYVKKDFSTLLRNRVERSFFKINGYTSVSEYFFVISKCILNKRDKYVKK